MKKIVFNAVILASTSPAFAQTAEDTSAIWSGVAFSVAAFVVLILAGVLIQRVGKRRKNDLTEGSGLDLMTLRQKNLLTPEEMKMVSQAIARRIAEKETKDNRTAKLSASTLLYDPEVQRLQDMAQAKRGGDARATAPPAPSPEPALDLQDIGASPAEPAPASAPTQDPMDEADEVENLDDVILPPDVQQLADAGILTPEEITNVKRRLKARG